MIFGMPSPTWLQSKAFFKQTNQHFISSLHDYYPCQSSPHWLCPPLFYSLILFILSNLFFHHTPPVFCPFVLPLCSVNPSTCFYVCLLCMDPFIQVYPALTISHIEESKRPVTIPSWCKKGWGHCQTHSFIVLPYRCLGKRTHCTDKT